MSVCQKKNLHDPTEKTSTPLLSQNRLVMTLCGSTAAGQTVPVVTAQLMPSLKMPINRGGVPIVTCDWMTAADTALRPVGRRGRSRLEPTAVQDPDTNDIIQPDTLNIRPVYISTVACGVALLWGR